MEETMSNYKDNSLNGMNTLITGCNKGIGLSISKKLASHGSNIIACCRKKTDELVKNFNDLKNKYKVEIEIYEFDLSEYEISVESDLLKKISDQLIVYLSL